MAPLSPALGRSASSRVVMLGAAPEAHGAVGTVVEAYRAQGFFRRWPVEYLATGAAVKALRGLGETLASGRAAVVHLHTEASAGFWRDALFMGLARAARCPVMLQLHGGGFQSLYEDAGAPGRAAIRAMLEHAAYVVVPCQALATWARGVAQRAEVVCVPIPVVPAEAGHEGTRPNLVLFLARLEPAKGIFDLLEALCAVRVAVPDLRLVCAGDGDRAAVARHAESLGVADMVKFTGWAGPSAKRALLESAAVFALPAYDEALPTALLEAMAAGVPVVATPVGGVPEVMVDGVSGFFAAPGDVATLQRQLRKLLLDRALASRIGAAARESVRLRCAPERAAARLGELYASLGVRAWDESPAPLAAA
jgi:glycosyltransferase involved in cell wall biosynthesis